jgi:hypothetical protein
MHYGDQWNKALALNPARAVLRLRFLTTLAKLKDASSNMYESRVRHRSSFRVRIDVGPSGAKRTSIEQS